MIDNQQRHSSSCFPCWLTGTDTLSVTVVCFVVPGLSIRLTALRYARDPEQHLLQLNYTCTHFHLWPADCAFDQIAGRSLGNALQKFPVHDQMMMF